MSNSNVRKLKKDGRDLMRSSMVDHGIMSFIERRLCRPNPTSPKASIIAMKGPPFTRKTEFAHLIAESLGCPILSLEHFLDELQPPPSSPEREEEAFRIICRMAHHHLSKGLFKNVVIDSPLSSTWHLTQLTTVASSLDPLQARVVIIECKPMSVYTWQLKLERHLAHRPLPREWYKPKKWEDVEKAIQVNGEYDERSVPGHELVSKLVLDPLLDHPVENMKSVLLGRIAPPMAGFVEAVKYMITRNKRDGPDVVVYHQWKQQPQHLSSSSSSSSSTPTPDGNQVDNQSVESLNSGLYCSSHGHDIVVSKLEHEEADCMACQKQVMRSDDEVSYSCKDCSLALHKNCAESCCLISNALRTISFARTPHFHKTFACNPCRGSGKGFSDKCGTCLFKTHLRCRLMPTVIRHSDTEEHLLTIVLLPATVATEAYRCVACGYSGRFRMYLCKICGDAYHYKCVKLARRVEHEHGGHHHRLALQFSSEEAEDYICNECHKLRDPMLWFYSCEDCPYELHPSCIYKKS